MERLFKSLTAFAAAAVLTVPLAAQTQSSPLILDPNGENYYELGRTYGDVYYQYTAPANQLVILDGLRSFGVTEDSSGTSVSVLNASYTSPVSATVFYAESGKTYLIDGYTNDKKYVQFTPQITASDLNNGQDQSNPIIGSNELTYLPCTKDGTAWNADQIPIYVQYTPDMTGKMVFNFTTSVNMWKVGEDGTLTKIDNTWTDAYTYRATQQVTEGEPILFKFTCANPLVAYTTIEEVYPGSSLEDAFQGVTGENILPAAAGTYWYSIPAPATQSFMLVSSEAAGSMAICSATGGQLSSYASLECREEMSPSTPRFLKITKPEATVSDETFTIIYESFQPYDKFETAEPISAGEEVTTPMYPGRYYYAITAPESGSWFIDINAVGEVEGDYTLTLYNKEVSWSWIKSGKTVHYEVSPGVEYVILVNCASTLHGMSFKAEFNEVQPGESPGNPLTAHLGVNQAQSGVEMYYTYTPEESQWIYLELDGLEAPTVTTGESSYIYPESVETNKIRWEGTADVAYLLRFDNVGADATFTISTVPFSAGEDASTALEATTGENILPEAAGKTWLKYVAGMDGFVEVSTNLVYDYNNTIYVYINEVSSSNRFSLDRKDYYSNEYGVLKKPVSEGDVVYIFVKTPSVREDKWIKIENTMAAPGETPNNAFVIEFVDNVGTVTLPQIYSGEVWYKFIIEEECKVSTTTGSYVAGTLYSSDATTSLGSIGWQSATYTYGLGPVIVTPGIYYVKYTSNYTEQDATWTISQLGVGESMSNAIAIPLTENPATYQFESKPTGTANVWYALQLHKGTLSMSCPTWNMMGYLKNAEGENIKEVTNMGNDVFGFTDVEIPEEGTYYLAFSVLSLWEEGDGLCTFTGTSFGPYVGVSALASDDVEAEYYTLQGVKVSGKPAPGLYIVKRGDKTNKVIIK